MQFDIKFLDVYVCYIHLKDMYNSYYIFIEYLIENASLFLNFVSSFF